MCGSEGSSLLQYRCRPSDWHSVHRRLWAGVVAIFWVGSSVAASLDIGIGTIDVSDAEYGSLSASEHENGLFLDASVDDGVAPFTFVGDVPTPTRDPKVETFVNDPRGGKYILPFNPIPSGGFASGDIDGTGDFNVGVSANRFGLGRLLAEVEYTYSIFNNTTGDLSGIQLELDVEPIQLSLTAIPFDISDTAHVAIVQATIDVDVFDDTGLKLRSETPLDIFLELRQDERAVPLGGDMLPLGMVLNFSEDVQSFIAGGATEMTISQFPTAVGFDVVSVFLDSFKASVFLPALAPLENAKITYSAGASLFTLEPGIEFGGQARIGDPFSTDLGLGLRTRFFVDEELAVAVPISATFWLVLGGIGAVASKRFMVW